MEQTPAIKMLVFHYKNGPRFPDLNCYAHIWAGKNGVNVSSELTGDDTGESISAKNNNYSELTGIYWFWKNKEAEIIGTCHYRRFYTAKPIPVIHKVKQLFYYIVGLHRKRTGLIYCSNRKYWEKRILNCTEIKELLSHYDAVLPQARTLKYTVEKHYSRYHRISDLELLKTILDEKYPEYSASFQNMLKQKRLYANNMFILKREQFQELQTWLFCVLFEFEKRVDLAVYTDYQERLFGFLSERLITTWFLHHKEYKIKELPLIYLKHLKKK